MKKNLLIVLSVLISLGTYAQKVINIKDMGASSSNQTGNTAIIQKAIDEVSAAGGGTVIIPAGRFVTGVLTMKSNVNLHLDKYTVLAGSTKRADYGPSSQASALIIAKGAKNISITGEGMIDAQGEALLKDIYVMLHAGTLQDKEWQTENPWHQVRPEEENRPKIINFEHCKNVIVKGITLRNALCWVQRYNQCSEVLIDSINVESNIFWNNDGIDLVDCKNAVVSNSFFNCDDDGICLKSEDRNSCCENIFISNCVVRSSASAVKFGTASWGGFKNIKVKDIFVFDTFRSAIAIEAVDGGVLENIDVQNIKAVNTGNALVIRLGHRNKDEVVSTLKNVHISNMDVEVPRIKPDIGYNMEGPSKKYPHNVFPSSVTGIPGHVVENVLIENVTIRYQGGADKKVASFGLDSLDRVPENIAGYPEFSMFGELPSWAFYVRHVNGIQFKNVTVSFNEDDFRPAFVFDDVAGLQLKNVEVKSAAEMPVMVFKNTNKPVIEDLKLPLQDKKAIRYIKK
jgi:polygalacturonase